jgi:excisionase family DNA binding protein
MKAAQKTTPTARLSRLPALTLSIDVDPLVEVVRRHVKLSAQATRLIEGDFARLLRNPTVRSATPKRSAAPSQDDDTVLSTQDAANLVGVSRPYIVARIEAGDIPLHQQVGNQRRVLKSAVQAWHRREQTRRRRALGQLGAELDDEIFSR